MEDGGTTAAVESDVDQRSAGGAYGAGKAGGAYGAGKAGGSVTPIALLRQPHTILRIVSWLFSIIVFGCIINEGYINAQSASLKCVFNHNANACHYGVVVGVFAFLACIAFLALDVAFPQMSSIKDRKHAVIADLICSSVHTFLWFVGFCFLTNKWQVTPSDNLPSNIGADSARAAIAFSFFSIFSWGGIAFLAFQRYRLGASAAFASSFPQAPAVGQNDARDMGGNKAIPTPPYITGSGVESSEAYHKPPFSEIIPGSESFAPATY